MAGFNATLGAQDGMTPVLNKIIKSMNSMLRVVDSVSKGADGAFDSKAIQQAKNDITMARNAVAAFNVGLNDTGNAADEAMQSVNELNDTVRDAVDGATDSVNGLVVGIMETKDGIEYVRDGVKAVGKTKGFESVSGQITAASAALNLFKTGLDFVRRQLNQLATWQGLADINQRTEHSMALVMSNRGMDVQDFHNITDAIEDSMIANRASVQAGMTELASSLSSSEAMQAMMPTLEDFLVGTNGFDPRVAEQHATQYARLLGRVLEGEYRQLERAGFGVTEAQRAIIKYGSEMERVAVVNDIISASWGGVAEAMGNLPQGQLERLTQETNDHRAAIAEQLMPAWTAFQVLLAGGVNSALEFVADNLSTLAPIIGIATIAVGALAVGMGFLAAKNWWATSAIAANIKALKLQAKAMLLSPKTWIVLAITAIVTAMAGWENVIGVVGGAIFAFGAIIDNIFSFIWNIVATFVNFFANVFNDPIASIKLLFLGLSESVIGVVLSMVRTIENIINRIPGVNIDITSGISGGLDTIRRAAETIRKESEWEEVMATREFSNIMDAYDNGFNTFRHGAQSIVDAFNGLGDAIPSPEDYFKGDFGGVPVDVTGGNLDSIRDDVAISKEDLRYLRDIAEVEFVNRYTTAGVNVHANFGDVRETADVGNIIDLITESLSQSLDEHLA